MTAAVEARQRVELAWHRRRASLLLLLAAGVFLGARIGLPHGFWPGLIEAAAEAALVGGLADWFAVTALFRHPLGLPIPHTAIIPRQRDRLGQGLGRFVERHFLDPQLISAKLASLDPAGRLARWLEEPRHAEVVADRVLAAAPYLLQGLGEERLRGLVRRAVVGRLRQLDLQPVVVRGLVLLQESPYYQSLLDRLAAAGREALLANQDRILGAVSARSRWWVPERLDRRLAQAIVEALEEALDALSRPDHEARRQLDAALRHALERAAASEALGRELALVRDRLLAGASTAEQLDGLWDGLRQAVLRELDTERSELRPALVLGLQGVGQALQRDPVQRSRLNAALARFVEDYVTPFRAEIGRFMAEVVSGWDAATVTDRLELAVGRDLQYIRINGTLVGALAGSGIYLLVWAVGV